VETIVLKSFYFPGNKSFAFETHFLYLSLIKLSNYDWANRSYHLLWPC